MPKSRRGQSSVQQQTASRSGTRTKKDARSLAREEEKENFGRQTTESRQHSRGGVFGATTTFGVPSAAAKASSKGVGKRKLPQVKEKKLPLQDITSQFLPAPESANRGAGSEGAEHTLPFQDLSYHMVSVSNTSRQPKLLSSPLPPSSPPPDLVLPITHLGSKLLDSTDDYVDDHPDDPLLPDNKYDTENDRRTSSSSDPFGFAALERKLKEERKFVRGVLNTCADEDEDIYEELHEILVADTSSPRPVPRINQTLAHPEEERWLSESENQDDSIEGAPVLLANPHLSMPPTPHKNKRVHRRHSCEGPNIFSPCSSSLESSPSPTKTSANKRRRDILYGQDPLEEFNTEVDENGCAGAAIDKPPSKRQCKVSQTQDDGHLSTITWNLRPRRPTAPEKAKTVPKPLKDVSGAKSSRKAKSNSSKNRSDAFDNDDLEEKWNREREDRIDYFHRLAEYSVEKENVYII